MKTQALALLAGVTLAASAKADVAGPITTTLCLQGSDDQGAYARIDFNPSYDHIGTDNASEVASVCPELGYEIGVRASQTKRDDCGYTDIDFALLVEGKVVWKESTRERPCGSPGGYFHLAIRADRKQVQICRTEFDTALAVGEVECDLSWRTTVSRTGQIAPFQRP